MTFSFNNEEIALIVAAYIKATSSVNIKDSKETKYQFDWKDDKLKLTIEFLGENI